MQMKQRSPKVTLHQCENDFVWSRLVKCSLVTYGNMDDLESSVLSDQSFLCQLSVKVKANGLGSARWGGWVLFYVLSCSLSYCCV